LGDKKGHPLAGMASNVSFNIYLLLWQMGGHLMSFEQSIGSQHLSFVHSILAFFLAFFFPPLALTAGDAIRAIASMPKNIRFIFKN
jgi:hypothetical protein